MPPIRSEKSKRLIEQEGRIILAIAAYKNGQIPSINRAATLFNVPCQTLQYHIKGRAARVDICAGQYKLTLNEEELLIKWILDLDKRGQPPQHAYVQNMANHLLSIHGNNPPLQVGQNWVYKLVKCHPEQLKSRFSRRYNYKCTKCENPKLVYQWFNDVLAKITEHGILLEDIYNFNETGFTMGLIATMKVITSCKVDGDPKLLQPGNYEWVTSIETICTTGESLPSYIIFKGKELQDAWFKDLPPG
jgi:hypothetical protein